MDGPSGEEVRDIMSVLLPDPRSGDFQVCDFDTSEWRPLALKDQCAAVHDLVLPRNVEQEVRIQFDLARNLLIYAWFVFRFNALSQLQALRCLELALRQRVPGEASAKGMKQLLELALRAGLLQPVHFAIEHSPEPLGRAVRNMVREARSQPRLEEFEHTIEFLRSFRNDLAHGEPWLHPNSRVVLALVHQLIAALYPENAA